MFRMSEQDFNEALRAKIRAEMGYQDLSQGELARRLGWPLTTLHRRLRGHGLLAAEHLYQIAEVLDVPVSQFFPDRVHQGSGVRS